MADSPGALVPGSTPATASNKILTVLFTLPGLIAVGAGAWWLLRRKKTRKNPRFSQKNRNPISDFEWDRMNETIAEHRARKKAERTSFLKKLEAKGGSAISNLYRERDRLLSYLNSVYPESATTSAQIKKYNKYMRLFKQNTKRLQSFGEIVFNEGT